MLYVFYDIKIYLIPIHIHVLTHALYILRPVLYMKNSWCMHTDYYFIIWAYFHLICFLKNIHIDVNEVFSHRFHAHRSNCLLCPRFFRSLKIHSYCFCTHVPTTRHIHTLNVPISHAYLHGNLPFSRNNNNENNNTIHICWHKLYNQMRGCESLYSIIFEHVRYDIWYVCRLQEINISAVMIIQNVQDFIFIQCRETILNMIEKK